MEDHGEKVYDYALVALSGHPKMSEAEELLKAENIFLNSWVAKPEQKLLLVNARPTLTFQEDHRNEVLGANLEMGKGYPNGEVESFISSNLVAGMLHKFWNRTSDACPLEATEQEREEREFSEYVHSRAWANEEGKG